MLTMPIPVNPVSYFLHSQHGQTLHKIIEVPHTPSQAILGHGVFNVLILIVIITIFSITIVAIFFIVAGCGDDRDGNDDDDDDDDDDDYDG